MNRDMLEDQRFVLEQVIRAAAENRPDAIIVAGDIYDKALPSAEAVELFDGFITGLSDALPGAAIMLIAGNHDFIRPGSAYARFSFCPQVSFLSGAALSSVFYPQWNLEVHGFSYDAQEIPEARLEGVKAPQDGRKHILLAHGGDARHVPLSPSRLTEGGWDYVALGHIHRPAQAQGGRVAFPGSPEPLDRSETGAHGYYIGTLKKDIFNLEWHVFSDFCYTGITVNMTPEMTSSALEELLRKRADSLYREVISVLLTGRRSPDMVPDTAALERISGIIEVIDKSLPDYPLSEWRARPADDLLGQFVRAFTEGDKAENLSAQRSLYYGLDALMATAGAGKEAIR